MTNLDWNDFGQIMQEYEEAFPGVYAPSPFGVSENEIFEAVKRALKEKKPIPEDFDWYEGMPPDAVA